MNEQRTKQARRKKKGAKVKKWPRKEASQSEQVTRSKEEHPIPFSSSLPERSLGSRGEGGESLLEGGLLGGLTGACWHIRKES